jgi:hypothetical protein
MSFDFKSYTQEKGFPLGAYAGFLGVFMLSFSVFLVANARRKSDPVKPVTNRLEPYDLAIMGVATHKLCRIITKDRVTSVVRAPFTRYIGSEGRGEVEEEPRSRHGWRRGVGELLICPYCMGPWVATLLGFAYHTAKRRARFICEIFACVAISDFLHQAYVNLKEK